MKFFKYTGSDKLDHYININHIVEVVFTNNVGAKLILSNSDSAWITNERDIRHLMIILEGR